MTRDYLEQYRSIKRRIIDLRELYDSLMSGAYHSLRDDGTMKQDTPESLAVDRVGVEALACQLSGELEKMQPELDSFCETIDDPLVRAIVSLRYESCLDWTETAKRIGNNSAEATRMIWSRYCKTNGI